MNAKVPEKDFHNQTNAYGLAIDEQDEILTKMESFIFGPIRELI